MSSVPAVIDALLAGLRARPSLQGSDVVISDGMPTESLVGKRILTVGGKDEPTVEGSQSWGSLGLSQRAEEYTVRMYAATLLGSVDQRAAREIVLDLYEEVAEFVHGDPSLGNLLNGEGAEVSDFRVMGHHPDLRDDDGNPVGGRWAEVAFDVRVRNRI